jgi:hypothetical protein
MPFLEIVTRTFNQRPKMLAANVASVEALRGADATQVLLVDLEKRGVASANAMLAEFTPCGQYVLVLDDDDVLTHMGLVEDLKQLAWMHGNPPAFIVRMDHGDWLGVLPSDNDWKQEPHEAGIGSAALIARKDVWMAHRATWASGRYASDFDFIHSVWCEYGGHIVWHDVVASKCQRISRGQPEMVQL